MLIKYDLLSVEAADKLHICIDLLCDSGLVKRQATFKETYEKTIGIYTLERENQDMWKMIWDHKIFSLFQMTKQSGVKGISTLKPTSVDDLAILNSTIRLMAQEKGGEMPTDKLARFKNDPNEWDREMTKYKVDRKYKAILEPILGISYGLCIAQEQFMELVQLPELGGFNLTWADRLRKAIAKKAPKDYDQLTKEFYERVNEKHIDKALADYVWKVLVAMSRGYGFNQSHTLAYSLVALQEMNLCFKYPIIFWNCACLIADSGGVEQEMEEVEKVDIYEPENFEEFEYVDAPDRKSKLKKKKTRSADYGKIATAVGQMRNSGIEVMPPDINKSGYTFSPDVENNKIIFGLRGLKNIGEEIVSAIIANRPYSSMYDFYYRIKPKHQVMETLIKCGAFDSFEDRKFAMGWFIWESCDKKKNLTLQNMGALKKYDLLPKTNKAIEAKRVYEFNRYLKQVCKGVNNSYNLDERGTEFLISIGRDDLIGTDKILNATVWDKVYQKYMDVFREWLNADKANILENLNQLIFQEEWNDYAKGSISSWEMASMCYYYHEHELANINNDKYGYADFAQLPETPEIEYSYTKGGKNFNIYKLDKICGTCIDKDKAKSTVTLLTTTGIVTVKFAKNYFALFDKRISEKQPDGTKKIKEYSWFDRGSMIVVQGVRIEDQFITKKYASTIGHQLYKIDSIDADGNIELRSERYQGTAED